MNTITKTLNLTEGELSMFNQLRIGVDLLEEMEIHGVTDAEARNDYGVRYRGDVEGIIFPYFNPAGERVNARVRRRRPEQENGKPKNKYVCAAYDSRHLYLHKNCARFLTDVSVPIIFVESEKAA